VKKPQYVRAILVFVVTGLAVVLGQQSGMVLRRVVLPTGKALIGPTPGRLGELNGFAAAMAVSPDGRYAAILNDGYGTQKNQAHQSIAILDVLSNQIEDFPDERLGEDAHQSYFLGLAFGSDGRHLYASVGSVTHPTGGKAGDTGNGIAVYRFESGKIIADRFLKIPPQKLAAGKKVAHGLRKTDPGTAIPYPAGLTIIPGKKGHDQLLVADNYSDNVVLLDATSGKSLKQMDLSTHELVPSSFPYAVVASRNGRRAWCSLWNASRVAELDLKKGTVERWIPLLEPKDSLAPGSHPTAMLLSPDEQSLYVALSNADRVAVVDASQGRVTMLLDTTVAGQRGAGTFPNALALSRDGKYLFAADATINAVAVFHAHAAPSDQVEKAEPPIEQAAGFIPTEWYPSALAPLGDDLLIGSSKGQGTGPNSGPNGILGGHYHRDHPYIGTLLYGSLARLAVAEIDKLLPEFTKRVQENNLLNSDPGQIAFQRGSSPIHHVIYVIKENRTYDQIFGDLKIGNGDPSLVMYGADVTPNEHKLALQFGVLDNFYDTGEVSGDGHNWSTAAITSDYNEKTWQINYRGRERTYDFQGTVADEFPLDHGVPDVDDPGTGYLWDNLAAHGMSYRDYGEFAATVWCKEQIASSPNEGPVSPLEDSCPRATIKKGEPLPDNVGEPHGAPSPWPWAVPAAKETRETKAALRDHVDVKFPEFNTEYPDQLRADEFLNEFGQFVQARKEGKGSELPAFVLLYLPNDHTHGKTPGAPSPSANVADNDLALGRVVEAVSHSPYWDDTAIMVLEDDAQNGADHVDAHRSIAFVISKYSPGSAQNPFVDHHFYTTVSMIHTAEALLGLPAMNQNDAYAPVMIWLFTGQGDQPPFTADWSNRDNGLLYQMNRPRDEGAKESLRLDFSRPDAANAAVLNAILWRDRKGDVPMQVARQKHSTDGE
jgi:DNA-binding beta-propeller fold protein YncE